MSTGIDIYVANSTGDAIFKHHRSNLSYVSYVISVGYAAVKIEITITDSNCTTNSIINIYWNEDAENSFQIRSI